jgi:hypothetical protein
MCLKHHPHEKTAIIKNMQVFMKSSHSENFQRTQKLFVFSQIFIKILNNFDP